jgi:hypothetical protein
MAISIKMYGSLKDLAQALHFLAEANVTGRHEITDANGHVVGVVVING